jgi:hypothetical protein
MTLQRIAFFSLVGVFALALLAQSPAHSEREPEVQAPKPILRTARLSLWVEGDGKDAYLELPLPPSDEHQEVLSETLVTRGFEKEEVVRDGNRLAILTHPAFEGRKRITYEVTVRLRTTTHDVPQVPVSTGEASDENWVWLRPTKQLQSSSPLIREKLIAYARPRMLAGERDALRLSWDLASTGYRHKANGSKTVLKATRTGHASDKGLERLFATFLRTSGVPARPVVGVDLRLSQKQRSTLWVEALADGSWIPMSVSKDLWGKLPARYLKLAHGDRPFIVRKGVTSVKFRWKVTRAPQPPVEERT